MRAFVLYMSRLSVSCVLNNNSGNSDKMEASNYVQAYVLFSAYRNTVISPLLVVQKSLDQNDLLREPRPL